MMLGRFAENTGGFFRDSVPTGKRNAFLNGCGTRQIA
jgi:hypothetical protein